MLDNSLFLNGMHAMTALLGIVMVIHAMDIEVMVAAISIVKRGTCVCVFAYCRNIIFFIYVYAARYISAYWIFPFTRRLHGRYFITSSFHLLFPIRETHYTTLLAIHVSLLVIYV